MAPADVGQLRPERLLEHLAGRLARQDVAERRVEQAEPRGERRSGGLEYRAAVLDVLGDRLDVDARHDVLALVAVEDDQVELVQLDLEQLADRKRDQRKLVDRRAVLLLGRAQNREMHQVDRRVGLQQVAPGALASMRLARDQQHAQPVADAVDGDHRVVVDGGQLVRSRSGRQLDDGLPAVLDRHLEVVVLVGRHRQRRLGAAVPPHRHRHGVVRLAVRVLDPDRHRDGLVDQAEGRRAHHHQPPIDLAGRAGQQRMDRAGRQAAAVRQLGAVVAAAGRLGQLGHVVDLAVGDQDGAREAAARHVRQRAVERVEQPRAAVAVEALGLGARAHDTQLEVGILLGLLEQLGERGLGLRLAVADRLARRLVDDHDADVLAQLALLVDQRRVGERQPERRRGEQAPTDAARAPREREADGGKRQRAQHDQRAPGDQGRERDREAVLDHRRALIGRAARGSRARGLGRSCSCRSARTSPG